MSKPYQKRSDGSAWPSTSKPEKNTAFEEIGFPGEAPFTRGVQPTMYRGRLWTMRQYAGFGSARETNARFRNLLHHGQTGLSVAFDLPTQMGYDPGESLAKGEVGRVGVSIASLTDMEELLEEIPLERVSVSMTINSTAAILFAFVLALAKKRGIPFSELRGTLQNDVLKEYIARGTYIYPPQPSLRLVTDIIEFSSKEVPQWNPISISGYHIREAGSDATQEVAFTLSNAITYVNAALERGLDFDSFGSRLSFFFNSHNQLIEEIGKFRGARKLWGEITRDRFSSKKPRAQTLRFHAQTAGSSLTAQQSENNLVRVTIQAMAAILGGCQSLHTNSKDEALGLPTETSALLALRTQQILAEESGIANVVDPLGGSFAIENETERISKEAGALIQKIDEMGGSIRGIETGFFQKAIAERAYAYQQAIEKEELKIVGVNSYQTEKTQPKAILKIDPKLETARLEAIERHRSLRKLQETQGALKDLEKAAQGSENLMPFILEAVEKKATLGEISHTLRGIFGTYHPPHLNF